MATRYEQRQRDELAHRNDPRNRGHYGRRDRDDYFGDTDDYPRAGDPYDHRHDRGHSAVDSGWPFVPMPYAGMAYGPHYGPHFGPGVPGRGTDRGARDRHERDFMDRAGDDSWFGDEDAQARRAMDHRGRGPKGYVRSDARINEDVHDRLTEDPDVDASEITVSVKDREVTLDGTVDSRRAKRHAEDSADSVSGVQHVQNNLRVQSRGT